MENPEMLWDVIVDLRSRAKNMREDELVSMGESCRNEIMAEEFETYANRLEVILDRMSFLVGILDNASER